MDLDFDGALAQLGLMQVSLVGVRGPALKRCHFSRVNPVIFACSEVDQPEHWHLLIEGA
jgi:hypothetical protein